MTQILAVTVAAAAAALLGLLVRSHGAETLALDLSIGVFGGLITAITFALALTIQQGVAWPSARAIIGDSGAFAWLITAVVSLALAVAANMTAGSVEERISTASVVMSGASILIGASIVAAVLNAAGGPGRHRTRARLLANELRQAAVGRSPFREARALSDFLVSFRRSVDAQDLASMRSHVNEVVDASKPLDSDQRTVIVQMHLAMAAILGTSLVRGRQPVAATTALQDLLLGAVDYAGRALDSQRVERRVRPNSERLAVLVLGEASRLAAFLSKAMWQAYHESSASAEEGPIDEQYAVRMMRACHDARERIRFAVDPDPPEKFLRPEDPWREGVTESESVLLWLWAHTDFEGTNQGSALYTVHEVFVGEKFFGSVYEGGSVISDIRRRLELAPDAPAQELLSRYGGFDRVFLEIAANSIGQMKPYAWEPPPQLTPRDLFQQDPRKRLRYFIPLHATTDERPRVVDAARAALVAMLSEPRSCFAFHALDQYSAAGLGPLKSGHSPGARPAAAVIATALTLMEHSRATEGVQRQRVISFLRGLPSPLVARAAAFATLILGAPAMPPSDDAERIMDQLAVVWAD